MKERRVGWYAMGLGCNESHVVQLRSLYRSAEHWSAAIRVILRKAIMAPAITTDPNSSNHNPARNDPRPPERCAGARHNR